MTIYVLSGFNNYYNRVIKKFETLSDYEQFIVYSQSNYNFVPNDGVNTTMPLGSLNNQYSGLGDYVLITNELNEIVSRWFIIDSIRDRAGQYTLTVRRDLIADHFDEIMDAPMFIEKATLNSDSPFIFNNENIGVNQIKKGEYLIENNLKTPWIVAYLGRKDGEGNYNTFSGEFKLEREPISPNYVLNSLDDYEFSNWVDNTYLLTNDIDFRVYYYDESGGSKYKYMQLSNPGSFTGNFAAGTYPLGSNPDTWPRKITSKNPTCENPQETYNLLKATYNTYNTIDSNGVPFNSLTNIGTDEGFLQLSNEIGKTIQVGNKYYEITADIGIQDYDSKNRINIVSGTDMYKDVFTYLVEGSGLTYNVSTVLFSNIVLPFSMNKITLKLREIPQNTILEYNFTYDKAITTDVVYEIIATPLNTTSLIIKKDNQSIPFVSNGSIGLQWFQDIYTNNSTKVYDIQIVPYIALDSEYAENYEYITVHEKDNEQEIKAIALKLQQSSFNLLLPTPSQVKLNSNVKIGNETELWRITSPNGVGNFDFNPYKNKVWDFIEVDCTLLPIQPYIKVNPMFNANGLYGGDYNDFRGLICSGDFSISLTNSEWQTYQQQNKNFQAIFDRQIESLEFNNKYSRQQDIIGSSVGSLTGASGGALLGSMIMPGVGTAIGAIAGGIASAAGGAQDIYINEKLRNEAMDLRKDQWGYELGNIKARSTSLSKTTSYNINNKYFPYIEFFTCTPEEKIAVANKIAYNGMTVMVIGKLKDYINNTWSYTYLERQGFLPVVKSIASKNYVKGQLIRLDSIDDDFHIVNSIAGELNKGIFIGD